MKLLAATHNKGKLKEIRAILDGSPVEVVSLDDVGYADDIPETGQSFFENASIKARTLKELFPDYYVLADDSGLEVDALNGAPGVRSARYAGDNSTQLQLINKLLGEMTGIPSPARSARFVCVMVLISPEGIIHSSRGECPGAISFSPAGSNGFGYDPVFLPSEFGYAHTLAEVPDELKNRISHRARALSNIRAILTEIARRQA